MDLEQISPHAAIAVIASEDQQFPFHAGFDFNSIREAVRANEHGKHLRGASTISQQVAKNLFLWTGHSFVRKGLEAWFTVLIETLWPKERILEMYLNIAQFGDGVYGVQAAVAALLAQAGAQRSRPRRRRCWRRCCPIRCGCTRTGPRATCWSGATGSWRRCAGLGGAAYLRDAGERAARRRTDARALMLRRS